ncbi:MAG: threonine/serine exporter family protein [Paramuribaculum sp.]|nr:threonine/serine exporter family protein [Paramuribaculum sp.]
MIAEIIQDAFFAAIASVGFAAISHPPKRVYLYCGLIAAIGHSVRFVLMGGNPVSMHIVPASLLASFVVGTLAVLFSPLSRTPAETCLYPSLLPMIPGVYAYRSFGGLAMCILGKNEEQFDHYFYLFASNGLTCLFILAAMVIGATLPIFIFKKISFQATR